MAEALAEEVTRVLRKPDGAMTLFPIQAAALKDAWECQGLLSPIQVGGGKTLVSLLLPLILESERPLLILPAKLVDKTKRERARLSNHWRIPNWLKIESYELLGRVQGKAVLDRYSPDLIIADEAHKLKNKRAAVTKRVGRYIHEARTAGRMVRVCTMSGTYTRKSLRDYAHIAEWCLRDGAPLPRSWVELEDWANALDELENHLIRVEPGALLRLVGPEDRAAEDLTTIRKAYARRLTQTPGVISSKSNTLGTSLQIAEIPAVPSKPIDQAFEKLRTYWTLPDGWELIDGQAVWRHARELALGFYYVWDPRPPKAWCDARREWCSYARDIIRQGKLDSELDVALAHPDAPAYLRWRAIRESFKPNQRPVWLCDSVLVMAAEWMAAHHRGIVWTEHVAFGDALELCTGVPYFRQQGLDKHGRYIEDWNGPLIASVEANKEGRNLQFKWSDNLVISCPSSGLEWDQLLGRTHRTGQTADECTADVYVGCIEHAIAWDKSVSSAHYEANTTLQPMKLCYADLSVSGEAQVMGRSGARWHK